jgi:hypothetical protein
MTTDQLETDLRDQLAAQAASVPADRVATVANRRYRPRTHDRRIPVAVSGLAAAAVTGALLINAGHHGRAVADGSAPPPAPTSAATPTTSTPAAAPLVIRVAGYTVTLAPRARTSPSTCRGSLSPLCGPVATGIVTRVPAGAKRVATPNPGKPGDPLIAYLVTSTSGDTTAYLPGVIPDGKNAYLEVDFGRTPYSPAEGFAVPSGVATKMGP